MFDIGRLFNNKLIPWILSLSLSLSLYIYIHTHTHTQRVWWVNYHHFEVLILCMCFVCFRSCLLCSKLESAGHCLWGKQNHDAIHSSRNLKTASYAVGIYNENSNTKILECLGIKLRIASYSYWWKPNTQSTSSCLGWSLAMVTLCLHSSSHMASNSIQRPTSRSSAVLDQEDDC